MVQQSRHNLFHGIFPSLIHIAIARLAGYRGRMRAVAYLQHWCTVSQIPIVGVPIPGTLHNQLFCNVVLALKALPAITSTKARNK